MADARHLDHALPCPTCGRRRQVAVRLTAPEIAIHDDRWFTHPWGVNGGQPGARARKVLRRIDGTTEVVGNKREDLSVQAGDELDFITWGGGGWGDPLARDPALVALEVEQGLITPAGARAYGVVLTPAGTVNPPATTTLRDALRAPRPDPLPLFNYGPAIEDLRRTALADTGLEAPRPPPPTLALLAAE